MPHDDGFESSAKILDLDINLMRISFISSGVINQEALKEECTTLSRGYFIENHLQ